MHLFYIHIYLHIVVLSDGIVLLVTRMGVLSKLNLMSEQRLLGSSTDKFCIQNKLNISQLEVVYSGCILLRILKGIAIGMF